MHLLRAFVTAPLIAAFAPLWQHVFRLESHGGKTILDSELETAIYSILEEFKSPGGVAVAVVHKDPDSGTWNVETQGYGIAKADGTKVTADTLFGIGSNSKLFTILSTGLLISNESLSTPISWDTKIASFVPEWALMDPLASAESTIVDVMSHRTGLPRHDFIFRLSDSVHESIRRLRHLKPSASFRSLHQYNNHMYTLLSSFPSLLTGIPFETYADQFIFKPLGMDSTTHFSGQAEKSGNLADGFAREGVNRTEDLFGRGRVRAMPFWAPNDGAPGHGLSGPGGVISNAKDMATWLRTLLNEGRHPETNTTVIPSHIIRRVAAGVTVSEPVASAPELSPIVYGGGQRRGTYRGFELIEHGGSVVGFKSQVLRIPDQNLGVAVLSNDESFGTEIVETIKFRILDKVLQLPPIDWTARFKALVTETFTSRLPIPRPENPTLPSIPFGDLVGKYHDLGYGTIELCRLAGFQFKSEESHHCRLLLEELRTNTTIPDTLDGRIPTFIARWDRVEFMYVSLAHFDRNLFNVSALSSIPTGNKSEPPYWTSSVSDPNLVAEFVTAEDGVVGVGMSGVSGSVAGPLEGESVKERVDVWFAKVSG
ncbi:beta-lactamase/transpeptidase-like protein [Roridomyces roridus]|uniref:Beta-lactamase/transpeptidase-like protein n=1 Tax=Roridomyces roridus TaxID=1738132 RepID=A0AAD7FAR1_9AGAR|nr:beta-lactamase/transpeptidase-like protein [Roridomyces roridus]